MKIFQDQDDAETAQALRVAASKNKGSAPGAWLPQSGSFTISGGSFATPDAIEDTAIRTAEGLSPGGLVTSMAPASLGSVSFGSAADARERVASAMGLGGG